MSTDFGLRPLAFELKARRGVFQELPLSTKTKDPKPKTKSAITSFRKCSNILPRPALPL